MYIVASVRAATDEQVMCYEQPGTFTLIRLSGECPQTTLTRSYIIITHTHTDILVYACLLV